MVNVKSVPHKKGFTLFEVIIALVIFSVVLISLMRLNHQDNHLKIYYKLQNLENKYLETGVVESDDDIKLMD